MELIFQIAVLLFLALIALELFLLRTELLRLPAARQTEEKKDSPTINVNVGTMPPAQPPRDEAPHEVEAPPVVEEAAPPLAVEPPPPEPEPEPEPPPPVYRPISVKATASGLTVVKCPACQAENSSYRSECFNCGASLG
jgi:outer membrane biosynthesis protein TonB